jgi:hypothetical protein
MLTGANDGKKASAAIVHTNSDLTNVRHAVIDLVSFRWGSTISISTSF